jgi:beta-glucosidase
MKMVTDEIKFPENFWWGTSLSAHQAEGGNINSWSRWEKTSGNIKDGHQSGLASDHWNKFSEDFEALIWLNANTHRMSIEWSRLEPKVGEWNQDAEIHYRKMFLDLKARGIRTIVCLFHFSLPLWVEDLGGFENPEMISAFVSFAKRSQEAFGDLINHWITLNEPVVYALGGYAAGLTPPGKKNLKQAMTVTVNMLRAHGLVYHAIKNKNKNAQITFAHHLRVFTPKNKFSLLDRWGAMIASEILNWSWYKTIKTGKIIINIPTIFRAQEECPECLGALDYIGFNYYSRDFISVKPFTAQKFFVSTSKTGEKTDMNWEIYPEGLITLLKGIKRHGLSNYPLVMTENGIADRGDKKRAAFIFQHLKVFLQTSIDLGLQPLGYLYWALIDNFEWIDGFHPRFGLIAVDYKTQKRNPRESAHFFKEMGRRKAVFDPLIKS